MNIGVPIGVVICFGIIIYTIGGFVYLRYWYKKHRCPNCHHPELKYGRRRFGKSYVHVILRTRKCTYCHHKDFQPLGKKEWQVQV